MRSVYDLRMLRILRCRICRSIRYSVFSIRRSKKCWTNKQQTATGLFAAINYNYALSQWHKLEVHPSLFQCAVTPCTIATTVCTVPMHDVPYPCTMYRTHVPCTVPMYQKFCTKSAAISTRSAARIGTTFLVHGYGTGYMGSVQAS